MPTRILPLGREVIPIAKESPVSKVVKFIVAALPPGELMSIPAEDGMPVTRNIADKYQGRRRSKFIQEPKTAVDGPLIERATPILTEGRVEVDCHPKW